MSTKIPRPTPRSGARTRTGVIGRPPDVDGADTRHEILQVARRFFAEIGYAGTTTRMISDEVGVSSAAIHHYFGRKKDLAIAVWIDTTDKAYSRLYEAVRAETTFQNKVGVLMNESYDDLRRDEETALFMLTIREDARRTPELAEIRGDNRLGKLIREIVDFGVETGAVNEAQRPLVQGALSAVALGVTLLSIDVSARRTAQAVEGCRQLFGGTLISPPQSR
ncbi:TetR/AcrR family transcriptional regulator [uncultured Jatrophihabitans sp.]|uniref:TetR/AcrR family transcriptional regulator n=1 Tax=uncultured Jatrophihabitans sp. TaxID=1610747 RepID=UPI0035CB6F71